MFRGSCWEVTTLCALGGPHVKGAEVWGARPQKNTLTDKTAISWYFSSRIGHEHKEICRGKSITLGTVNKTEKDYEISMISDNILYRMCVLGLVERCQLASRQLICKMRSMDQLFPKTLSRPDVLIKMV